MAGNAGLTVQDIINEALGILGVYTGDPLSGADLQSAFFTFQALVDGWTLEPLTFQQSATLQFTTTAGKSAYTLAAAAGSGVDWVPPFLPAKRLDAVTMQTGTLELGVNLDTLRQWEMIALKSMSSSILTDCYVNYGPASHVLNFWPVPSVAIPVNLYVKQQIAKPTATTAAIILAPGYQEPLTYELAIKCSSKFGAAVPEWLPEAWRESKARLAASNFPMLDALCDRALLRRGSRMGGGSISFYMGE